MTKVSITYLPSQGATPLIDTYKGDIEIEFVNSNTALAISIKGRGWAIYNMNSFVKLTTEKLP